VEIGRGQDGTHARRRVGRGRVDLEKATVGLGAANDRGGKRAGALDVVHILAATGDDVREVGVEDGSELDAHRASHAARVAARIGA
jgi:hypothetical protein